MPAKYDELEIGLSRRDDSVYTVSFRLLRPESDDTLSEKAEIKREVLNPDEFTDVLANPQDYGQRLTERFFSEPNVRQWYTTYKSMVLTQLGMGLRLRLNIGVDAPELHRIHWELLCEPGTDSPIATNQNILFSRYLTTRDVRRFPLKSRNDMKALIVIANPLGLGQENMPAPIDAAREVARAREGLKDIRADEFPDPGRAERATLTNIIKKFSDKNDYDILYLVCHGSFNTSSNPMLLLENDDGKPNWTSGKEFAVMMKDLLHRPTLVVLASCESAGSGTGNALSAFGPSLVEDAGVPAVLAMQGRITMKTVEQFMPLFFDELRKHGYIDLALAAARGMVRGNDDYWMPVLYMRSISGRLWYVPGYTTDFDLWDTLKQQIEDQDATMTPIIGPGIFQPLLGSLSDIAESWAQKFNYPLALYERDSLAKVAQFLYGIKNKKTVAKNLEDSITTDIQEVYKDNTLPQHLRAPNKAGANELISAIGRARREANPNDAYNILARLPVKVYITTNLNNLLTDALVEADKHPKVMVCPWNNYTERLYRQQSEEFKNYEPDVENPLVFHMFGRLGGPRDWESLVLTEDDYFDFLLGYSRNAGLIPKVVKAALTDSAWLFVGFEMEDWGFRVLFRSILSQEGIAVSDNIKHMAAQFVPEEGRVTDSEGAQRYLEKYFGKQPPINLYWGSAEEFLQELAKHIDLQLA